MLGKLNKYAVVVVPYGTAVCLAHLFGKWGAFGVNPLEYVGLSDVFRLSLYPMLLGALLYVGAAFAAQIAARAKPRKASGPLEFGKRLTKGEWVVIVLQIVTVASTIAWGSEPTKWIFLATAASFLCIPLSSTQAMEDFIPNLGARYLVLLLVLFVPASAFARGRYDAYNIKTADTGYAVAAERFPVDLGVRSMPRAPVIYAGRLGDHLALYETLSKQILLVPIDRVPALAIREK